MRKNLFKSNYTIYSLFLIIFLILSVFRIYNVNYDQLWWDEIITLYTADPSLTFSETINRNFELELSPPTFNLVMKYFYSFFGYNTFSGRYLSAFLGILTCLVISLTVFDLTKKNFNYLLFSLFISGINVSLISTSQEMRLYSLLFFLVSMSIFLFCRIIKEEQTKKRIFLLIFFFLFTLSSIFMQPWAISIFVVFTIYAFINSIAKKSYINEINICAILLFLPTFFYYYFVYINQINLFLYPDFLGDQVNLKFISNLYFSKYFGSRIMGLIYLSILIYLIIFNKKTLFQLKNVTIYLLAIIFITYLIPIIYGFLFKPILLVRYVLFVMSPIIVLIPVLIYELRDNYKKNFLLVILVLSTLINSFTESNVKQFFDKRPIFKPDFYSAFKHIDESEFKDYIYASNEREIEIFPYIESALYNYSNMYSREQNFKINFLFKSDLTKAKNKKIWIICAYEINFTCKDDLLNKKNNLINEISLNRLNLKLIQN